MMSVSQDRTVHEAAHILRNGVTPRVNGGPYGHIPYPEDEEHLTYTSVPEAGNPSIQMSNQGPCSSSRVPFSRRRRLFCLLTVFDFSMLVMLWVIYSQFLALKNYGFVCQVEQYTFQTSMFDVALLAFWRVVFLLLVYGLIRSEKWYAVAFSTLATSVLVICKTFFYDFTGTKGEGSACHAGLADARFADVIILIASFVIVWFELFILDFQVIKRERRLNVARLRHENGESERSPLLSGVSSSSSPPVHSHVHPHRKRNQQRFYSPFDSPADSDQELEEDQLSSKESLQSSGALSGANFESLPNSQRGSSINLAASLQEQKFFEKSEDAFMTFEELIETEHEWTVVKTVEAATISTLTHDIALSSIIFRLEASFPVPAEQLFTIMWEEFESSASWNPTVKEVEVVQSFGPDLQVIYTVANSILISSRDFVSIRQHSIRGETHLVSDISVEHPTKPVTKDYVRGESGISGWVVEPENTDSCRFCWIVNTDIKMKLCPQNLLRQVFSNSLVEIYQGLNKVLGIDVGEPSSLEGS